MMKKAFIGFVLIGLLGAISLPTYQKYANNHLQKQQTPRTETVEPNNTNPDVTKTAVVPKQNLQKSKNGWQPSHACDFLADTEYFPTHNHMKYIDALNDGKFMCSSREFELPSDGLPNDLTYRVLGSKDNADMLKLVLDLHQPNHETAAIGTAILIANANKLSERATGKQVPDGIPQSLLAHQSTVIESAGFTHTVERKDYPNGNGGYEIHYILTKQSNNQNQVVKSSTSKSSDNSAKQNIVKKVYLAHSNLSAYRFEDSNDATPELKKIMQRFLKFDEEIRQQPEMEMGCDMATHFYFGFGQDVPDDLKKTLQIKEISDNKIRATFKDFDGKRVGADISLNCQNNRCLISDVKNLNDKTSMKTDFLRILKNQTCG